MTKDKKDIKLPEPILSPIYAAALIEDRREETIRKKAEEALIFAFSEGLVRQGLRLGDDPTSAIKIKEEFLLENLADSIALFGDVKIDERIVAVIASMQYNHLLQTKALRNTIERQQQELLKVVQLPTWKIVWMRLRGRQLLYG